MHAHDRTLVSQLMADPDRKDKRHDLACQYVAQPEVAQKILEAIFGDLSHAGTKEETLVLKEESSCRRFEYGINDQGMRKAQSVIQTVQSSGVRFCSFGFEVHVTKGEGKYATTIGFVDLVICGHWKETRSWVEEVSFPEVCRSDYNESLHRLVETVVTPARTETKSRTETDKGGVRVIVEVKATPVPVSDIIRQLKLYAAHASSIPGASNIGALALVTCYALTPAERAMLSHERIESFELGKDFEIWVQNESARATEDTSLPTIL